MIVDSSAVLAILRSEPNSREIVNAIRSSLTSPKISSASYAEIGAVIDQAKDPIASRRVDELIQVLAIRIEPITKVQAEIAREAYKDFGKGSGHRAGLNIGDTFSYALAKDFAEPLLFKGNDFLHTDVECASFGNS